MDSFIILNVLLPFDFRINTLNNYKNKRLGNIDDFTR